MKNFLLYLLFTGLTINAQEYTVQDIGFAPPNSFSANSVTVDSDDLFTSIIPIGFEFEFYGNSYTELIASGNGVLSFNTSLANSLQNWNLFDEVLPSNYDGSILNSIMLWHDLNINDDNRLPESLIGFSTFGVAPNRRFVANFNKVPHYLYSTNYSTFQIVIYETSNIIEFFIQHKPYTDWNDGRAILGILNIDGTQGLAAPNCNNTVWEGINEAWRFVPYQAEYVQAYPASITVCLDDASNTFAFDLTSVNGAVSGYRTDVTVSYHLSEGDAFSFINAIEPLAFQSSPTTVYARVEGSNGLIDVSTVTLDIVACNDDADGDNVVNGNEDINGNGNLADDDTDNDGIPNYLDGDDDNDNVITLIEVAADEGRLYNYIDTDNDGIENYLDNNDDNDSLLTIEEDYNENGSPFDDDQNQNGIPDYLEAEISSLSTHDVKPDFGNIIIYPNPTTDELFVEGSKELNIELIEIYNASGKAIKAIKNLGNNNTIIVSDLPPGQYFIRFMTQDGWKNKSFLKK